MTLRSVNRLKPAESDVWSCDAPHEEAARHLGCPVGLYEQELQVLVCPCHQSMFNVTNGAIPEFGPAPRPLPQLPLYIDSDGYIRSQSDYHQAVGPGFWERTTT